MHIQLSREENRYDAKAGKADRIKKDKHIADHQQHEMFQTIPLCQLINDKSAERKISNMQNIGMRKTETPAENMSEPQLPDNPINRMFQTEKGKNAEQNGAHGPHPQTGAHHLFQGNVFHSQHQKHDKKDALFPRLRIHKRRHDEHRRDEHRLPPRIGRNQNFDKSAEQSRRNKQDKKLLSVIEAKSLCHGQQQKEAKI